MKREPPDIIAPEVIATVGGLVDEVGITLAIYGEHLEPDAITKMLGMEPMSSHRRGDQKSPRSPPYQQGAWLLSVRCEAPVEPDDALARLLATVPDDEELWTRLGGTWDLQVRLGVHYTGWNKGFDLSPTTLQRLARMRVRIVLHLYAYGDDEEQDDSHAKTE